MKLYVKNNPGGKKERKNIQNIYIQQFKAVRIGQYNNKHVEKESNILCIGK